MTANAGTRLLQHYVDNFRRLPWRSPPDGPAPDPYRVWLSEVMLQQTTVAAVTPRFERFLTRWPTVGALAAASDEDILGEWAGLGYYARARNLVACARELARRGGFPKTKIELRKLPGIGDYTAAAIAAIAFGEDAVPVDTNVSRVIARLRALASPSRGAIEDAVRALTLPGRSGDIAQALMDLGATICRRQSPACAACPLSADCAAYAFGTPEAFPAAKPKRVRPVRHGVAYWTERAGNVWLVRRPARGLLGGMTALPSGDWQEGAATPVPQAIGTVRHVFTHFALELQIVRASEPVGQGWWQPLDGLAEAGLPTLYRRAVEVALASRSDSRAAA